MTNEEETLREGNKLIAQFIGMKFLGTYFDQSCNEEYEYSLPVGLSKSVYGCPEATVFLNNQFLESWDWLMPVVEKIENYTLAISVTIRYKICRIYILEGFHLKGWKNIEIENIDKIKAVWLAIVEFIKWYNENNTL